MPRVIPVSQTDGQKGPKAVSCQLVHARTTAAKTGISLLLSPLASAYTPSPPPPRLFPSLLPPSPSRILRVPVSYLSVRLPARPLPPPTPLP